MVPTTIMTHTRTSTDVQWFHEHYADNSEVMALVYHLLNFYESLPDYSIRVEELPLEIKVVIEFTGDPSTFTYFAIDNDCEELYRLVDNYINETEGLTIDQIFLNCVNPNQSLSE